MPGRRRPEHVADVWYRESGPKLTWELPGPRIVAIEHAEQSRDQDAPADAGDLAIHHLVERVAIEAVRVSRSLTGKDLQRRRKAGYEREVPGPPDHNAFRVRHRPRQAFGMIPHQRQVIVLRSIDKHGNRDLRQRIVGEGSRVRRHDHNGPYPRIAEIGDVADLARGRPSGGTTGGAEPGVIGMLATMCGNRAGTGFGTDDGQRGETPFECPTTPMRSRSM